jgi:hypothetical protein
VQGLVAQGRVPRLHGWNDNVGMTAKGIGQISILDAKASDLLPIHIPPELATH